MKGLGVSGLFGEINKNMFNPGIEPGAVCVLGRRDNQYTNWTLEFFGSLTSYMGNTAKKYLESERSKVK